MGILADKDRSALTAHRDFARYLQETGNTICGRHPIGILYGALAHLEETTGRKKSCTWVKYDQSLQATNITDDSVSYASAWIKI
jgi:predicted class III extradiol MEMO1 family dioxygenase